MAALFKQILDLDLATPFPRLTYDEAMGRYGLDKPDTRFGLELKDISDIVAGSGFKVFAEAVGKGGIVKALNAKGCSGLSRKDIDDLTAFVAVYRAKGMAWVKVREDGWQSPIAKFFTDAEKQALAARVDMATWGCGLLRGRPGCRRERFPRAVAQPSGTEARPDRRQDGSTSSG